METIRYICTNRLRDFNRKILLYRLYGSNKKFIDIEPDELKAYLNRHELTVENLYLTSDNRLKEKYCDLLPRGIKDHTWVKAKNNEKRAGVFCKSLDRALENTKSVEERVRILEKIVQENIDTLKKSREVVMNHRAKNESDEDIIKLIINSSGSELLAYMTVKDEIYAKLGLFLPVRK